jgi:hypothetical protein
MSRIILDAVAADQLKAMPHSVHISDVSGKIHGRFFPLTDDGDVGTVVLDTATTELFKCVDFYPAELCDSSGRAIGRFYRRISGHDMSEYEPEGPEISDEELDALYESNGPTYTSAEVIAHLQSLDRELRS